MGVIGPAGPPVTLGHALYIQTYHCRLRADVLVYSGSHAPGCLQATSRAPMSAVVLCEHPPCATGMGGSPELSPSQSLRPVRYKGHPRGFQDRLSQGGP